jgi:FkbM family methyltransferase
MPDRKLSVTLNGNALKLAAHDSILIVDMLVEGQWEPHLFRIFDRFLRPDRSYVDAGAFIGTSVMYGAQLARHCYAIEPNPLAYRYLVENTEGNNEIRDKVTRFEGCIWDHAGRMRLGAPVKPHGTAASLLKPDSLVSWLVTAVTLEDFLGFFGATDVNFIKMDIEGAESVVIPQMAGYLARERPGILLSLHAFYFADRLATINRILDSLDHYRYLYLRDGTLADRSELRRGVGMEDYTSRCSDIIASDEPWQP